MSVRRLPLVHPLTAIMPLAASTLAVRAQRPTARSRVRGTIEFVDAFSIRYRSD